MIVIPTSTDFHYDQSTSLDGAVFVLTFRYSQTEACWYLSLAAEDGTKLAESIKLVCNTRLLRYEKADRRMPQGELMAIASGSDDSPPGLTDLAEGGRVQLVYFEASEL